MLWNEGKTILQIAKARRLKEHTIADLPRLLTSSLTRSLNIILCGKVDWLEYLPENDNLHIIDFKTGVHDEKPDSLQLLIYCLLVKNLQPRKVKKISFWYLDRQDEPTEMILPDLDEAHSNVLELA